MTNGVITTLRHFDSKAEIETHIRGLPIVISLFMRAWYMQNFVTYIPPQVVSSYKISYLS